MNGKDTIKQIILKTISLIVMMSSNKIAIATGDDFGSCGDNVMYFFNSSAGTLTISGKGPMKDGYNSDNRPWSNYSNLIKSVIIEYGVTSIGHMAFSHCPYLTSVTIPNSVTSINRSAFSHAWYLTSINIPGSVTSIGTNLDFECRRLKSVTYAGLVEPKLINSTYSIGERVFASSLLLKEVNVPRNYKNSTFFGKPIRRIPATVNFKPRIFNNLKRIFV